MSIGTRTCSGRSSGPRTSASTGTWSTPCQGARGTYIALCEGDDYWIDPLKLSRQVAFLDRHPETAVCFHPVRTIWEDGRVEEEDFPPVVWRDDLSLDTLIRRNFIQTNSVVYRRLPHYRDIPADVMPLDHYLMVRHAFSGKIAMLPETMAVYRRHSQGMWNNRVVDPLKFWLLLGGGHAALYDAMIDLAQATPRARSSSAGWLTGFSVRSRMFRAQRVAPRSWTPSRSTPGARCWPCSTDGPTIPICCWPGSKATPKMGRRSCALPSAISIWAISLTRASGMRGGLRWAAATRRSTTRCTGSRSRCRTSVSRGQTLRTPICAPGSFDRPAPSRCYAIAFRCRVEQRYKFAYLFAERAAKIPLPEEDRISVSADIYAWRATDEQAVCASWIGRHAEAFTLCRGLLARPDLPDPDRQRIATNRDLLVPAMIEAAAPYPEALVQSLAAGPGEAEVTVSLVAGPDRETTEQTIELVFELLPRCVAGRALSGARYRPVRPRPREAAETLRVSRVRPSQIRRQARRPAGAAARSDRRTVLAAPGRGWRFFAPENFITRLTAVLDAEPQVFQVGINFADAAKLTGASAAEQAVRRAPDAGRYLLTEAMASGPAMFDTARLDRAGGVQNSDPDPLRPT